LRNKLNLIGSVDVRVVSASDNDFLQSGIEHAKEVFTDKTENVHTDGAYHSVGNQAFCEAENINLYLNAIQGGKGRFDLFLDENNELKVIDSGSGITIDATRMVVKQKWRITVDGKYRYFTLKEISSSLLRRKIAEIPQAILNIRNNVEATIFQLGYHFSNDKTKYRGLIKHKMWANSRCIWVNFVRIMNYVTKTTRPNPFSTQFTAISTLLIQIFLNISSLNPFLIHKIQFNEK